MTSILALASSNNLSPRTSLLFTNNNVQHHRRYQARARPRWIVSRLPLGLSLFNRRLNRLSCRYRPVTSATQEHDGHHIDKEQQPGGTDQLVNNTEAGQEEIQVDQKGQQDNVDDQAGQEDVVGNEHAFAR